MPQLSAASAITLQLEDVNEIIPMLVEVTNKFDARIKDNGRATRVSTKSYRVRMQTTDVGNVAKFNLDGGTLPAGGASQWDQFLVTPIAIVKPVEYTRLADETGEPKNVSSVNPVSKTIADAVRGIQRDRDCFLQTAGDGKVGQVLSTYAGGGANPVTLEPSPWGARLLRKGQKIQVMSNAFALRATATITNVVKTLGATQSITLDAVPGGTVAGDFIVVDGVAAGGSDPFINGFPVFHSTATTGTLLGISRANNYVVANGVNANNAQITLPLLRLAMNQVLVELGDDALKDQIWHTHPSQLAAYEELGFQIQFVQSQNGKFSDKGFDGLYDRRKMSIEGYEILANLHADNQRWDFTNVKTWGKVKWGQGTFWFKNRGGQTVFQQYDTSTGTPKAVENSYLVDAFQTFIDNAKVLSSVTNCKLIANN